MHSIARTQKILTNYALDRWMPETKTHLACTIHGDAMLQPLWLGYTFTYAIFFFEREREGRDRQTDRQTDRQRQRQRNNYSWEHRRRRRRRRREAILKRSKNTFPFSRISTVGVVSSSGRPRVHCPQRSKQSDTKHVACSDCVIKQRNSNRRLVYTVSQKNRNRA